MTNIIKRFKDAYDAFAGSIKAEELSDHKSSYYDKSQIEPYNPDDLVQKKGLQIYQKMLIDDQVKSVMNLKTHAIFANGWTIEKVEDTPKGREVTDFIIYSMTDGLVGSFKRVLGKILSGMSYGFSVSEKVFKVNKEGDFKGKIGWQKIKTRPPFGFEFYTDKHGNLEKLVQQGYDKTLEFMGNDLNYFVLYAHNPEFDGEFYGRADLREAYRAWWSKRIIYRFMNIYLERFGMGIVVGKYPRGMGKDEQDDLFNMIKNIQSKTAFKLPKDVEIAIIESKTKGQSSYIEAIQHYNRCISRAALIPDKLGFTDEKGGSYNLGENQFNLFMMILEDLRSEVEESIVDEQLIKQLVDLNYTGIKKYPKFKLNPLTQKNKENLAKLFIEAVKEGTVRETEADEDFLRDSVDFPKFDKTSPVIEKPKPSAPGFGNPQDGNEDEEGEEDKDVNATKDRKNKELPEEFAKRVLSRKPNQYEEAIDFKKIVNDLDKNEFNSAKAISKVVNRIKEDVISSVVRKKIIENKDFKEVDKIQLKHMGDLKSVFGNILRSAFMLGKVHGKQDIIAKARGEQFAKKVLTVGNLPPKEALMFFENKKFFLTGTERDHILKNVKAILHSGIETGKTTPDVVFGLEEFFEKDYKMEQLTPQGKLERVEKIPGRLETIVRTNVNDVYNQGKLASFQDPDVKDFISAYEYSAIMDNRTSPICKELDGKIYKTNDPVWADITPSNHFNCRSTIIPILADETFDVSTKPTIGPAKGFGG